MNILFNCPKCGKAHVADTDTYAVFCGSCGGYCSKQDMVKNAIQIPTSLIAPDEFKGLITKAWLE